MKILMITPWYPDEQSPNSGIFIRSQAEALRAGHSVVVIVSKVDYRNFGLRYCQEIHTTYNDVEEYRLIIRKSLPIYNQLNFWWLTLQHSLRIARSFRPDIIHASIGYPGAFWGWFLSKGLNVPFVLQEHTRVINNFRSATHKMLTLFGLKRAHKLLAVGKALAYELKDITHKPVTILPNIVEVERFYIEDNESGTHVHIGFLGGMNTSVKGLDLLLEAAARLTCDYTLHIGGSGTLEADYKKQAAGLGIADRCVFYGFIPTHEIPPFMVRLNFFVCASRYETFCVALVEAMAAGLPVLSTKCGGPQDFVTDLNGLLVDTESVPALHAGLVYMVDSYRQFERPLIAAYAHEHFSRSRFLKRIEKIYQSVLA